jgi:hypothetical protein
MFRIFPCFELFLEPFFFGINLGYEQNLRLKIGMNGKIQIITFQKTKTKMKMKVNIYVI